MPTTVTRAASTFSNNTGTGTLAWGPVTAASLLDSVYASASGATSGTYETNYLYAQKWGLNVPLTASVNGWTLTVIIIIIIIISACTQPASSDITGDVTGDAQLTARAVHKTYLPYHSVQPRGKLGMSSAWQWGATRILSGAERLGATWVYDWTSYPPYDDYIEGVPMIYNFTNNLPVLPKHYYWVLGPNEPDLASQANMTVEQGVDLQWRMEQAYSDRKLVSPAPSDQNVSWLIEMATKYRERHGRYPRWQAIALHCYKQSAASCIAIIENFKGWARVWGVPEIWLTEFAFLPAYNANAEAETKQFIAYLEKEPMLTRYSPFVAHITCDHTWPDCNPLANPSLYTKDGRNLTTIGSWYKK